MRDDDFQPATIIPGLKAWLCSYDGPDGQYGIVLYAADPAQILEDHCLELPGLTVDGEYVGSVPHQGGQP